MLEWGSVHPCVTPDVPFPAVFTPVLIHLNCDSWTNPIPECHRSNEVWDLSEVTGWLSGREGTGTQISSLPAQPLSLSALKRTSAWQLWLTTSWASGPPTSQAKGGSRGRMPSTH